LHKGATMRKGKFFICLILAVIFITGCAKTTIQPNDNEKNILAEPIIFDETSESLEIIEYIRPNSLTSANIRVYYADNEEIREWYPAFELFDLNEVKDYNEFIFVFDTDNRIVITTEATVSDFKLLYLTRNWEENRYLIYNVWQVSSYEIFGPETPIVLRDAPLGCNYAETGFSFIDEDGETRYFALYGAMANHDPPVRAVEIYSPEYFKTLLISDELNEEMVVFFHAFLKTYAEGDEEVFKTYMSDEFYNEYLEYLDFEANRSPDEYWNKDNFPMLNQIVPDMGGGLHIIRAKDLTIHDPGITFWTGLMRQSDIDNNNEIGARYLINISYNENHEFLINWFGIEQ